MVPTHARPQLMAEAVESVLAQDYAGPLEVVVVFDACEPVLPDVALGPEQTLRAVVKGVQKRVKVCTRCLRSGKLAKPAPAQKKTTAAA